VNLHAIYVEVIPSSGMVKIGVHGIGEVVVKESLGIKYLRLLVTNSNRTYKPSTLRNLVCMGFDLSNRQYGNQLDLEMVDISFNFRCYSFIPATDLKTIVQIRNEIKRVNVEILEATFNNDLARKEELYNKLAALEKYLNTTVNINGIIRALADKNRNDYYSIKRAICRTIKNIRKHSSNVADYIELILTIKQDDIHLSIQ
jgi:hypothetical protein